MAESNPPSASPPTIVVGIDLGALTTKITLGPSYDHELVRNAQGGHTTPTAVTFSGKHRARLLGEDAAEVSRADGNTVGMLDRLLVDSLTNASSGNDEEDALAAFRRFQLTSDEQPRVNIPNMEEEYSTTALMAMLLGNVKGNVIATVARLESNKSEKRDSNNVANNLHFVFAIPPSYPQSTRNALMDAAFAASISNSSVVDSTQCMAAVYDRKFGDVADTKEKTVLVVEMGHARSCVSILKKLPNKMEEPTEKDDVGANPGGSKVKVLSTVSSPTLGAGRIDIALYHHFLSTHPSLAHHTPESIKANSRPAQRLLEGCRKLKHLLSMLPENTVTVENIGKNETDVNLSCTRELLKQLCQENVIDKLKDMIELAMEKATVVVGDIEAVEITGGGLRIPFIQETIRNVIGKGEDDDFVFSRSLDDTSLAFGASLVGIAAEEDSQMMDVERNANRAQLLEKEVALSQRDVQLLRKDELRNQIEAHILELRSARHSKHGSLLPTSDEFTSYLDDTDDWLFSEECDESTTEQMEAKWNAVQSKTQELCGEYLAAKRDEAERKDREMEKEAKMAAAAEAAEAAMNGDEEVEDHDNRRLPTKRRMEIVLKNKNEANELISDGNYRHAAARYAKALTHCTKFFDLSPTEEEEVKQVKLSLYLNSALAYIKLEKMNNAYQSCNDALKLDRKNVKALYRRATVLYHTSKFDDAMKDLKAAEKLAPNDKAVKLLQRLVDKQMAKQKKKEKTMAQKMFG
mmetsp:Transcript_8378/g.15210  ORF Transcript_8378/g.15210 Transcript_8378/m.15210 type:complete len:748 (+) Transcript_8378:99-2342(+)|eukprot:CAMPEP_0201913512 /NCGR_PEP_ID=MMETSP0903-20130614/3938_1 /ASSEMBLY_ACC=CAM_ASM_000552 /TAXON_ID=420261 /ORGANISM="Thalassiosira antarctica, Strain CCMP982" /LENGTH=747 /DNA_ID=CAMNT_0048448727 /DNA_START=36 /DNA_END=2279 /DNA_ORIENTATION=+